MNASPARTRPFRLGLCACLAVVAIVGAAWLRGAARSACAVTSPLLNGIDLIEYGVACLVAVAAVCALLEAVGGGWWVVPAAVLLALAAAWVLLVRTAPPADYPNTVSSCTHNLPTWWPASFPS